jgi:hypothetical protein
MTSSSRIVFQEEAHPAWAPSIRVSPASAVDNERVTRINCCLAGLLMNELLVLSLKASLELEARELHRADLNRLGNSFVVRLLPLLQYFDFAGPLVSSPNGPQAHPELSCN